MNVTPRQARALAARLAQDAPDAATQATPRRRTQRGAGRAVPSEEMEQIWFVAWFDACADELPPARMLHVPNGGARHPAVAAKMKAMGVRPGVWDTLMPYIVGGRVGLALELKRRDRRNHLTPEQDDWGVYLRGQGWHTVVAYSCQEAAVAVLDYLDVDDTTRRALLLRLPWEAR